MAEIVNDCPKCDKPQELCLCAAITPMETALEVLILQHPQEPDKLLGTAKIAHLALTNSKLRVGLSWPNLAKAAGHPVENARWGVLYLGGKTSSGRERRGSNTEHLRITSKSGEEFSPSEAALEGIVVLDGTWSQAKTLWWRNPWVLKLKRMILTPPRRSLYGNLRREPRRECLSTIESIAEALEALGENQRVAETLRGHFAELIRRYRARSTPATSRTSDLT